MLGDIARCAPGANATTKQILLASQDGGDRKALLTHAAGLFAAAARGPEGEEGTIAFLEKRLPAWASSKE